MFTHLGFTAVGSSACGRAIASVDPELNFLERKLAEKGFNNE